MHFTDIFTQSNLQYIQAVHFICLCSPLGNEPLTFSYQFQIYGIHSSCASWVCLEHQSQSDTAQLVGLNWMLFVHNLFSFLKNNNNNKCQA